MSKKDNATQRTNANAINEPLKDLLKTRTNALSHQSLQTFLSECAKVTDLGDTERR